MSTVYFLGAGASAADGLPLTRGLNYGVADWLRTRNGRAPELRALYRDLFKVRDAGLTKASHKWKEFLHTRDHDILKKADCLPDLIETLSLIDISIDEGHSFGMSSLRAMRRRVEMDVQFLSKVRRQLTTAIAQSVKDATHRRRSRLTNQLVDSMGPDDAIISTNWDVLPERRLVRAWLQKTKARRLKQAPIKYHCVGERPVTWRGDDLDGSTKDARTLLRLHGGLNWLGCACCATVYVNVEWSRIVDESKRPTDFERCHCGAGLSNIIIAPSFVKNYSNVGLRSVWREAQKRLEHATRWIFIGYSLPSDDFHVRALLLRALRSRVAMRPADRELPEIKVFLDSQSTAAKSRYEDLFRLSKPEVSLKGFQAWADQQASRRSTS